MATLLYFRTPFSSSGTYWEPVSPNPNENLRCLEIKGANDSPVMIDFENRRTIEFWKNLLPSEHSAVDEISPQKNELR